MTREADHAATESGAVRSTAADRGGSSDEPPAIQIKMPSSNLRPRMRNRTPKKNLGNVEELLQSLMTRLDENDRRYSDALGGLNERLNSISERAKAVSSNQSGDSGATLDRLRQQASSLAEQVGAADASHKAQHAPSLSPDDEPSRLSGANDDRPRPDFGDNQLNQNFADVTEKLEHSLSARDPAKDFDALSAQMDALVRRFDTALDARNDIAALEKIETQLNSLTTGFAEAQRSYAKVDAIEGHLLNLLRWAETTGTPGQQNNDSDRLAAIEQALIDLSDSAREMDSRTVSTLEAMNEALHSLAAHAGSPLPGTAMPPPTVPGQVDQSISPPPPRDQHGTSDPGDRAPVETHREGKTAPSSVAPENPYQDLGATIPDYQPPSQKSEPAASERPSGPASEEQHKPPNGGDASYEADSDFIASARRAAAAAAARPPSDSASERTARSKWNVTKNVTNKLASNATSDEKKTRPALVVAAVILLIVSAGLLYSRLNSAPHVQPDTGTSQGRTQSNPETPGSPQLGATPAKPADTKPKNPTPPKSGQNSAPDDKQHSGRMHDVPTVPKAQAAPRPKLTASSPQLTAKARPASATMPPGRPLSTATLLASLPPEARKPLPPDVTMEIKEPESASAAKPSRGAATPTGPALVPAAPANPKPSTLPQPRRASIPAAPKNGIPTIPGTIDSAPANEVANGLNGAHEVMPPARIGPQSLRVAAARGNPAAMVEVGSRYAKGIGVPKNLKKAAQWYSRAAAQAHAPAQYRLAAIHERGHGVKKDEGIAQTWYRRAAELGNIRAMHNLAVLYTRHTAGGPDFTSAKNWFYQAARHGLADSQFNLGILYESGLGTRKNTAEAYKWFSLAAQQGDSEARKHREAIRPQLPAKSLRAAEKAIRAWKKVPANEDANRTGPPRGGWRNADGKPNTKSADARSIARAQKLLNELGYDAGVADGRIGPQTKAAIHKFEVRSGNMGTGTVTPALLRQLEALAS